MTLQQFVILSRNQAAEGEMTPIGPRDEIIRELAAYNTAPERDGEDTLYGPGVRIELPPDEDPVRQMLITLEEEEIAWLVLVRLAKSFEWRILDPLTGRELNP
ncbi:MAG: hypothetical protein JSV91_02335 [Phycisphaerales bacterium]|nr:MAG: hypothetical protein JSV91_02335 [Phycisphaerales bacterium]